MLVENQLVEVKWNNNTKAWYESKGYKFTYKFDSFYVHPEDLPDRSAKKVRVICDYCGVEYMTSFVVYNDGIKRNGKNACSHCADIKSRSLDIEKRKKYNYERVKEVCENNGYELLSTIDDCNIVSNKIQYKCPIHGTQTVSLDSLIHGHLCYDCGRENAKAAIRRSTIDVIKIVESKNNNKILNPEEYIETYTNNLKIQCGSCGNVFITNLGTLMQGEGHCKSCGIEKQKQSSQFTPNQVESIINGINGNKLLNKSDYIGANVRNLRIICGSCGNEFIGSLSNIQLWSGKCHECSGKNKVYRKLETKEVIERVNKINNHELLNPEDYTGTTDKNLKIKCGKCGNVFITSLTLLELSQTGGCKKCAPISVGEEIIAYYLDKYEIKYNRQESFDGDCHDKQPLPFDFYLSDYNLCIEFDGAQHDKPIYGEEVFKSRKLHDAMKNWYCKWNNINLLRIPYLERDNIEQILVDYLHLTPQSNFKSTKIKYIPNRKTA